jgi:hypothetical protein
MVAAIVLIVAIPLSLVAVGLIHYVCQGWVRLVAARWER